MKYHIFIYLLITQISFGQWIPTNGPNNNQVWTIAVSGELMFAGTMGGNGIFVSSDIGNNWTATNSGINPTDVYSLAVSESNIFAGTSSGVFISTNDGTNWTASGLAGSYVLELAVSGTNIFAGTSSSTYRSSDNGASWTTIVTGLPANFRVEALAASNNDVFIGNFHYQGVYHSTNNGTTWSEANTGLPSNEAVYSLAISGSNLFAGTLHNGIFLSSDNGGNWAAINNGLTANWIFSLLPYGANLYAGTYKEGVFRTTNNGTEWTSFNFGLTDMNVLSLAILGNNIFAGTYSGIFKRSLSDTATSVLNQKLMPSALSLNQNYPNPFNPSTKIKYSLEEGGNVSLKIYDILGREIETLVKGFQNPGSYEVGFAPKNLSDGVYIYRLQARDNDLLKKMIYLK